jgi:hypothetical protein
MRSDFFLVYPPFVRSGLHGPPLGIQHLAWHLRAKGFTGGLLDSNIRYARELCSDPWVDELLRGLDPRSAQHLQALGFARLPEEQRLLHTRAFEGVYADVLSGTGAAGSCAAGADEFPHTATFHWTLSEILEASPTMVGFSILSYEQVPYSLALARAARERIDTTIVFGGSEITGWSDANLDELSSRPEVDYLVVGDGEGALVEILEGKARRRGSKILRGCSTPLRDVAIEASFLLDPSDYVSPYSYNVVESKGCYWNRCTHCDYIALHDKVDFGRDIGDLVSTLNRVHRDTGIHRFHLINETLAPSRARRLAEAIRSGGSAIRWNSFVKIDRRFSPEVMAALLNGGCEFLVIGLESLSARALRILDKGYTPDEAVAWIRSAQASGIKLTLNFIVGIPGTSIDDEQETLERLTAFPELAARAKVYRFVLSRLSAMGKQPEVYGLTVRNEAGGPVGHRGGSSIPVEGEAELEARYMEFRSGLRRLIGWARTAGPVGQLLLAFEAKLPLPETTVVVSPSVVTSMVEREGEELCATYDYRAGTTVTLPASFAPIVQCLLEGQGFPKDATAFLQGPGEEERAYVLRLFTEAGFLAVSEEFSPSSASATA